MDVYVKGTVIPNEDKWIYDWLEYDAVCPKDIAEALQKANGEDVTIVVNSGGGDVFAGNEINYLISQYRGKTTVDIVGIAASIATVICCGADIVRAVPGAQYMIHNVSGSARGDYHVMDKTSEVLLNANRAITHTYRLKTGMSEKDLLKLMDKESWMDAVKAKEYGFVDEIIGENGKLSASKSLYNNAGFANIIPDEVKEKIRNMVKNPNGQKAGSDFLLQQKARLQILRMRGI